MEFESFQADLRCELGRTRRAREILGVCEDASPDDIKRAWRKACLEMHPDRNPGDPDAPKRFRLAYCAYRCLTDGKLCKELLSETEDSADVPGNCKYNLANPWGFYLWWRERFFE
jgi:preprotein translocase subunit Sec63